MEAQLAQHAKDTEESKRELDAKVKAQQEELAECKKQIADNTAQLDELGFQIEELKEECEDLWNKEWDN